MGCACGNKNQTVTYVYTSPSGKAQTFKTEVEAKAAKIRNGGGSYRAA